MDHEIDAQRQTEIKTFRKLTDKFYEISDAAEPGTHRDMDIAHHVLDAVRGGCSSAENHAQVTGYHIRREMKALWSPDYIEWAEALLAALNANPDSPYDLRGHKKNTHTVS